MAEKKKKKKKYSKLPIKQTSNVVKINTTPFVPIKKVNTNVVDNKKFNTPKKTAKNYRVLPKKKTTTKSENPYLKNYSNMNKKQLTTERKKLQNQINNYKRKEKRSWWDKDDNLLENVGNVLYKAFLENQDEKYVKDEKYDTLVSKYDAVNKQLDEAKLKNRKYGDGFIGFVEKSNDVIVGNVKSAEKGITSVASKLLGHTPTKEETSQHQYEKYAQKALENSSGIEKVALDIQGNLARMVPQMAMPGKKTAIVTGFANYGGGAYNEARREGKSEAEATKYGMSIGALEMGLQKALGGLNNVYGKSALSNVTNKVMGNVVKNKTLRNTIASMGSEGVEEYIQDIVNPVVRNVTMNENNEFKPFTEEALYSALLGSITAGLIDGPINAVNSSRMANNNNSLITKTMWKKPSTLTNDNVPSPTSKTKGSVISSTSTDNLSQNNSSVKLPSLNNMQNNNKIIPIKGNENLSYQQDVFSKQIDEVLNNKYPQRDMLVVSEHTPQVLQDVGLNDFPITLTQKHLYTMTNKNGKYKNANYHDIDLNTIKQLPQAIEKPLNVLKSSTDDNSIVVITELADGKERPIIASIKIDGKGRINDLILDSNVMTSAYGRNNYDNWMKENIKKGNLLYDIDEGIIKRVRTDRLQLPMRTNSSVDNISQNDISVKSDTLSLNNMQSNNKIIPIKGNESKFYDNVTEKSKYLNEDLREVLKSEKDIQYYQPITNKETLEKAYNRLKTGEQGEIYDWFNRNNPDSSNQKKINPVKNIDAVDVAEGWILLKQFQEQGDYQSAVNVAKTMRNMGTRAGQAVQVYNILERLSPEGMVYYAQSELSEAYNKMKINKSKKWIEENFGKFDLTPQETEFIVNNMEELQSITDERQRKVKLGEIQRLLYDKLPVEKGQSIKAWMRISMLFNLKTQVRNVGGNALAVPVNMVSDVFSSVIDRQIAKKTGVRTTGVINPKEYIKGFKKGAFESFDDFRRGINTRNIQGDRFEIGEGNSFNNDSALGKKLNNIDRMLSFVLDIGDRTFYEGAFTNSINNQLKLNKTDVVTPEMIDIATNEALQRTWQDNNNYTEAVLGIRRILNHVGKGGYGLGDAIIPFAKTPANLTKAIVDYGPAGLVKTLSIDAKNFVNSLENGQYTPQLQHKFVQNLGKGMAGSFLYILGIALAKAGITSGENDDDKDVSNFMRNTLGIQPYSIKIGDKSFAYDWAQPIATPLAITANYVKQSKENPDAKAIDKAINALNIGSEQLLQQSFLESLNTVLNGQGTTLENLSQTVLELPSRAIPTLSKQIADMIDDTQRTSYEYDKPIATAINKVKAKIPVVSKSLAPVKDTLGRDVKKYGGKNNFFNVFLNPANVNSENVSNSAKEIYKIYKKTGDATILPRVAPYYINNDGEKIVLSSKEKAEFQEVSGRIIDSNVKKLSENGMYKKLNDSEKSKIISDIVNYSYNEAKKEVLGMEVADEYKKVDKYIQNGGKLTNYYLIKDQLNTMKADKSYDGNSISGSASGKKAYYIMNNKELSNAEKSYLISDMTDSKVTSNDLKKLTNDEDVYKYYFSLDQDSQSKYKRLVNGCKINQKEYIKFKQKKFEADKYPNGKTISGSKKRKVIDYVNSLSLSIPQKAMLIKSEYNSFDGYNREIVEYVNSQKMSIADKKAVLESLGFKIINGRIYG